MLSWDMMIIKGRSITSTLLSVNYHLFAHSDVSYRINGKKDNIVLELNLATIH